MERSLLIQPHTEAAITVEEFYDYARKEFGEEFELSGQFVMAGLSLLENIARRSFMRQTWCLELRCFTERVRLPKTPCSAVQSVEYFDGSNVLSVLPQSTYSLDLSGIYAYLELYEGEEWPTVYPRRDAIKITYLVGYESPSVVPQHIKMANYIAALQLEQRKEQVNTDVIRALLGSEIITEFY
ncbi:hypothetical protein [Teredinibacter turnerae]|uniref:hypothetical protein n=1 Tax=Teredinibacter turnerae TaxID=2426 RepID=UPI0030D2D15E